jgi:PAS domain S-box-containing protein
MPPLVTKTLVAAEQKLREWCGLPFARLLLITLVSAGGLYGLYELSRHNYLLFHWVAEGFAIVIAFAVFAIVWNARRFMDNSYFLLLGIAFLFIGALDFVHTLSYEGMGVFPGPGSNPATQLWISARYVEALTFLVAPLFIGRRLNGIATVLVYAAVTSLLLATMFVWHIFPTTYIQGYGLTTFKVISEYVVSGMLVVAIWEIYRRRQGFSPGVVRLLVAALIATIASEMAFSFYTDVYGVGNMIGHLLKVVSYFLIYKALIETGLRKPYEFLFRELKQSEDRLRESDRRLRWALRASQSGAWDWDLETGAAWWSPEMYALWGVPPDTVMTTENSLDCVVAGDRERVVAAIEEAIANKTEYECEFHINHAERGERWVNSLGHGVYDLSGRAVRMLGISLDITEHKRAEGIKDEFIGLVSHELRTPMTVLAGTLHVAGLPNITPEQRDQMLRDARQSAAQLGQILDNLVELARHQAGRLRLTAEPTDVRQLLRDIVRGEESGLEGFRLSLDLAEDLPSMEVDRVRVRQVIRNLLSNAAKYSPAGTEIKVAAVRREKHVIVSVRDRGRGMTPDEQSRLFQPFERLEQSTADSGGLGLGLVVCRRLVDAHGGDIWVESGPGEGSCFYFTLPLGS